MIKGMIRYICKRPLLWITGILVPALASFAMNYGLALGLEYYTAELSKEHAAFRNIVIIMAVTVLSLAAASILEDIARYIFCVFVVRTQNAIRNDMYKSLVNTRYSLLSGADRGKLYTNYVTDTDTAVNLISRDIFSIIFPLVHAAGYFAALFSINRMLGGIIAVLTCAVILLNLVFTQKFRKLEKEMLTAKENYTRAVDAAVRGKITIRQLQMQDTMTKQISKMANVIYQLDARKVRLNSRRKLSLELLSTVCTSLMTPFACVLAAFDIIELSSVVMIAQICRFIIMQTSGLGIAVQSLGTNLVSCERIQHVLKLPNEYEMQNAMAHEPVPDPANQAITFRNFGIAYKGKVILKDIHFDIEAGRITSISGASGTGKTSLIHAFMGLIEYSGDIRLYGTDIRHIKLTDLRKHVAYCPEHCQLFDDASIKENLLYAAPDISSADISRVLNLLSLQNLDIDQLARTLSGGQRQRISLARALLKRAEIIILDEPTAALDQESEAAILRVIFRLKEMGKTVILISHRRSTVEIADKSYILPS